MARLLDKFSDDFTPDNLMARQRSRYESFICGEAGRLRAEIDTIVKQAINDPNSNLLAGFKVNISDVVPDAILRVGEELGKLGWKWSNQPCDGQEHESSLYMIISIPDSPQSGTTA